MPGEGGKTDITLRALTLRTRRHAVAIVGACASARARVCVVFGCKTIERVNSEWARARERVSARARTIRKTDGNDSVRTGLIRQRQIHDGGPHSCAMKRQSTHKQKMLTYAENR